MQGFLTDPDKHCLAMVSPTKLGVYKLFPPSFQSLLGSIHECQDPEERNLSHLYRVKQSKDESLKDYLSRFDKAIMQVKTYADANLIDAFKEGVKDKKLL